MTGIVGQLCRRNSSSTEGPSSRVFFPERMSGIEISCLLQAVRRLPWDILIWTLGSLVRR